MDNPKVPEEISRLLKQVVEHCDNEDRSVRERQIRTWRKLKLMWENLQHHYYSEVAHDWRIPEVERLSEDTDQAFYDKPVNVFRALLESIIAALSVTVPPITCFPDDADNPLDVSTAKAGDKIAELIFRHNDVSQLWLHALFIYCTEGMIACWNYPRDDEAYGTYKDKKYEESEEMHEYLTCPNCGAEMADTIVDDMQRDKFQPDDEDVVNNDIVFNEGMDICPECSQLVNPNRQRSNLTVTRMVGETTKPKSRVMLEVYGGLYVKVPVWARNQSECMYLEYKYETHYANAIERHPGYRDEIRKKSSASSAGVYDSYEQLGRLSPQYMGEYPENNVTVNETWLRPAAFNILEETDCDMLKKRYPNGVQVTMINDCVVDAKNQNLDDCWTLTYNPLADSVHFDPLGLLLISVQEITNDLISLVIQTIEHGIPQTFADPKVLNFKAYRDAETLPGGVYPATPRSGKTVAEGFYEVRTASLSSEVLPFATKIQELGQIVSGALPSLFGGQLQGSRTASEYSMSRAQALQRLQTVWKMLTIWWKQIFGKAIPMYIKMMQEDEKNVSRDEFGNFVNVFIRKAELEGKLGAIELDANENLPITWSQQKDSIMQLLETNNEMIITTLGSPENIPYLRKAIGLTDYNLPGEGDRQKQNEEIIQLVNSAPILMPPDPMVMQQALYDGMPPPPEQELPSVEIEFDVDDHQIQADICKRWLVSDAGRLAKIENPDGYQNVLLHMKAHKDAMIQQQMQQQMQNQPPPEVGATPPQQEAPIQGEENVGTIQ